MKECKIWLGVRCEEIQNKLLEAGVRWGGTPHKAYPDANYLVFNEEGEMSWGGSEEYFSGISRKEVTNLGELSKIFGIPKIEYSNKVIFNIGDKVRVIREYHNLRPACINTKFDKGVEATVTGYGASKFTVQLDGEGDGHIRDRFLELVESGKDREKAKKPEWVPLRITRDKPKFGIKKPKVAKAPKNPDSLGKVYRFEVLYTDGTKRSVGGLSSYVGVARDSDGDECFKYTKRMNDDVECTFFVKRKDLAGLVLRYDNGKTEIYEYSHDVVDKIELTMKKRPQKTK